MKTIALALITGVIAFSPFTIADEVSIPVSQQGIEDSEKPRHSQSMQQIESRFGEPLQKIAAVGEPPITRWIYSDFTVYFEEDKVIHSVEHRKNS